MSELNETHGRSDYSDQGKDSFLIEQAIFKTPQTKEWKIIADITSNPNTNIYQIAKRTGLNYSTVHTSLKALVFAGVVNVKQGFDSQNRNCELFFIPQEEWLKILQLQLVLSKLFLNQG